MKVDTFETKFFLITGRPRGIYNGNIAMKEWLEMSKNNGESHIFDRFIFPNLFYKTLSSASFNLEWK